MKIAFITYEYPPDTAIGGIGTYVYQIAQILHQRGHHVEVFTASPYRSGIAQENNITIHRVQTSSNDSAFADAAGKLFAERHRTIHFDVLEGPETSACARFAVHRVPDIPLVVKLHIPSFMVGQVNYVALPLSTRLRFYFGALRRGERPKSLAPSPYDRSQDIEWLHALDADEVTSPSADLGQKMVQTWSLPPEKVVHIPNPYVPSPELLSIPPNTATNVVSFVGKLEIRKGILDFGKAIPLILKHRPDTIFRFIGAPSPSLNPRLNMQQYLEQKLRAYRQSLEFTGPVPLAQIPELLAETDICVFPSRWENFPNVCLEAMAAARGVVGSSAGGMAEMLQGGEVGHLVPPHRPDEIAAAVIDLLQHPAKRTGFGQAARDRILMEYNAERIGSLQEASYERAIQRRRSAGPRVATTLQTSNLA